jgi:hypothetical protein
MKEIISNPILHGLDFAQSVQLNNSKSLAIGISNAATTEPHHSTPVLNKSTHTILKGEVLKNSVEDQDAFYVANLASVVSQYKKWTSLLPRVTPFFGRILSDNNTQSTYILTPFSFFIFSREM